MLNKKVIAFYLGDFRRSGGTERACISVANSLSSENDLRVVVLTTNRKGEKPFFEISDRVDIIYLDVQNLKKEYFQLIKKIRNAIKTQSINILVAVEVMSILMLFPFFFSKNLKTIVWEHFNYTVSLGKKLRPLARRFASRYADLIIVLTQRDVLLWQNNLKIKNKIISINNPSPFTISEFPYSKNSKNIVAIGRLTYQKGFDKLVEIFNLFLKKNQYSTDWRLQIIGSGPDKDSLEGLINKYNISNFIELIPNTNNIAEYYKNSAFLAMTSRFEGLPMTLIEAQAFGLPILAFDCLTGPSEVITNECGILVEDDNFNKFIDGMFKMTNSEELRINMSNNSKVLYSRFLPETIKSKWVDQINSL